MGGGAAHLREVGGDGGEAAKDELVGIELIVGNDEDILANLEPLLVNLAGQAHKAGVQLGVEHQEGVSRDDVIGDIGQKLYREEVVRCKA